MDSFDEVIISLNQDEYNALFLDNNHFKINVNFEKVVFTNKLVDEFMKNDLFLESLKEALKKRVNLTIMLNQNDEILAKKTYSPVSIILAIQTKEDLFDNESLRDFKVLSSKIDFKNYINKNKNKLFNIDIDGKNYDITYEKATSLLLSIPEYSHFINIKGKYKKFSKEKYVYILKTFAVSKKVFLIFKFENEIIENYKNLIQLYDTEAINQFIETTFKYSDKVEINENFKSFIISDYDNVSRIEKAILIYIKLFNILKYDYEFIDDISIKKHKDFSRIVEITEKNNKVVTYEFSCLLAKIFETLNLKFTYNDNYIIVRINKFLLKFKSINEEFNIDLLNSLSLLKGINILNSNKNTCSEFEKIISSIYNKLHEEKIESAILKMPFNELINLYKISSSKINILFQEKFNCFLKLISEVTKEEEAIGYIYELKNIFFKDEDLNANISFATVIEKEHNLSTAMVIITTNPININLYNSNKYICYNPPKSIRIYNLTELRQEFFNGRLKYIKGSKDNIIGLEKSSIC